MAATPESHRAGHSRPASASASATAGFLGTWLRAQCASLPGVTRGVVIAANYAGRTISVWPEGATVSEAMIAAARDALSGHPTIAAIEDDPGAGELIAAPVRRAGDLLGAMALEVVGLNDQAREAFRARATPSPTTQAGHQAARGGRANSSSLVLDLLAGCVEPHGFLDSAAALCNELATRLACDRVSLGETDGNRTRVVAMSHSAVLDERSNLARDISSAMAEAVDQDRTVVWPAATDGPATTAHDTLARRHGAKHLASLPLVSDGMAVGALTLERERDRPFDAGTMHVVDSVALIAGPLLELKRRDARSILSHISDSVASCSRTLIGPRHGKAKAVALAAAALLAWAAIDRAPMRITAPAHLEGHTQRVVVAPLDGFVADATARAGDTVAAGETIARLDDRELELERSRWAGELDQLRKQYRGAQASHDRAKTAILSARIARTEAQLALLDSRIERTRLRAPVDGLVIAGDLSQLLGSPVARGDVLFEIAPLSGYRVVIDVDERDVGAVRVGQTGHLALEGLAGETLPVTVEKLTPVSSPRDGRNVFRVEARVDESRESLRPGMAGYAKIVAGERSRLWLWTHDAIDWLRLKTWLWFTW